MFWSLKYFHNTEYKMYLQNEKIAKLWVFVNFSNKRRFEQILYKTSLQNETVRQITKRSNRREVLYKKDDLKNSQNSPENTCVGISFLKVVGHRSETLFKKRLQHRRLQVSFVEFFKNTLLKNPSDGCFFMKDLFLSIFCNEKSFKQIFFNFLV